MTLDEARKIGAMALFGEKYGQVVRVVNMDRYSIELCGGTHIKHTKELIDFALTNIESIGSGVYRIEAVSGEEVSTLMKKHLENIHLEIDTSYQKSILLGQKKSYLRKPILGSYQDIIHAYHDLNWIREELKELEKNKTSIR